MGLDITAYQKLVPTPQKERDYDGHLNTFVVFSSDLINWTEENWPGRSRPVEPGPYSFSDSLSFRAGSYGGYGMWRNWLAMISGWGNAKSCWDQKVRGPFVELIDFADNEGIIGAFVAAKLAKDFAEFSKQAELTGDIYNVDKYHLWRQAFEMAMDGGAVKFH